MSLRTVVDLIDKAYLYTYIGDKVVDLRKHGINGVIEMMALGKMADDASLPAKEGGLADNSLFRSIKQDKLIHDLARDIGRSQDELRYFIYRLYNDPLVTFISDIWSRTLPQSSTAAPFQERDCAIAIVAK